MIRGEPAVTTATEIPDGSMVIGNLRFEAVPTRESEVHKAVPRDNAISHAEE
jgi:hypothetical protein